MEFELLILSAVINLSLLFLLLRKHRTSRQAAESVMDIVEIKSHEFEGGSEFETEALNNYAGVLQGLQVPDADKEKLLTTFNAMIRDVANSKGSYEPFLRGLAQLRYVAQQGVLAGRLTQMHALLAVKLPWGVLCQSIGCDVCISRGFGRLDDLMIGCIPGWKCYYMKVPEGFCTWSGLD